VKENGLIQKATETAGQHEPLSILWSSVLQNMYGLKYSQRHRRDFHSYLQILTRMKASNIRQQKLNINSDYIHQNTTPMVNKKFITIPYALKSRLPGSHIIHCRFLSPVPIEFVQVWSTYLTEIPERNQSSLDEKSQWPWAPDETETEIIHFKGDHRKETGLRLNVDIHKTCLFK